MIKRIVWFNFQRFLQYWKISSVHCIFYVFHIFIILQNLYDVRFVQQQHDGCHIKEQELGHVRAPEVVPGF